MFYDLPQVPSPEKITVINSEGDTRVGKIFFNWIFGFDGKVRIKAPEDVKQQYKEQILRAMEIIDK